MKDTSYAYTGKSEIQNNEEIGRNKENESENKREMQILWNRIYFQLYEQAYVSLQGTTIDT